MTEILLVRYGELSLKSATVRREFENRLKGHILSALFRAGIDCTVTADHGHIYVHSTSAAKAIPHVRRVFGVVSVSPVTAVPTDMDAISQNVVSFSSGLTSGSTFAIRTRRTGTHPFSSHDVDVRIGADVLRSSPGKSLRVDLTHPQVEVNVEIRGPKTYIYTERYPGPGGFPLGVAGRIGAHVGDVRGALGTYLMMKRGCEAFVVSSGTGTELTHVLKCFDPNIDPSRSAQESMVWDVLKRLVEQYQLTGVSLPLRVEEHAAAREFWGETVIFSPTVGLDDAEVMRRWEEVTSLAK